MERRRKNSERIHRLVYRFFRRNCSFLVLDSMPLRMRRWTQTVMRRRTKFLTFINRRAK